MRDITLSSAARRRVFQRVSVVAIAIVLLAGCAIANTPAQERGYAAYARCRHLLPPDAHLVRIAPDSRAWILGSTGREAFFECYGAPVTGGEPR